MSEIIYATPLQVANLDDCFFYHRMVLPEVGEVGTQWDLQDCLDAYLGKYSFQGKRVLDVGTASGYLTFSIEERGAAEVVSFDMASGRQWDLVPQWDVRRDELSYFDSKVECHRQLQNAYWLAHAKLGSRARVFYGNLYALPEELGPFDVAVMAMIISHLRDPLLAISKVARLCREHLIITNQANFDREATARLMPTKQNGGTDCWWLLSLGAIKNMLEILGFEIERVIQSYPQCIVAGREGRERCMSIVARRVEPWLG